VTEMIKLNVKEIRKLYSWIEANELKDAVQIKIYVEHTGIGDAIRATVNVSEDEGRFIDLTDYDSW